MKRIPIFILLIALTFSTFGQSIKVQNSKFADNKIYIEYSVSGMSFYQSLNVSLFVSFDNGSTFVGPLVQVEGDIGKITRGGDHHIIWSFLKEIPFTDEELIFDVRAKVIEQDRIGKYYASYVGNITTPIGIRFGKIGKLGLFLEARIALSTTQNTSYNFNGQIYDFDNAGYYELSGIDSYEAMSVLVGVDKQVSWNTFVYAAIGYGKDIYNFEINEYSYTDNSKTGESWVNDELNSYSGIEVNIGLMQRIGDFIISAGGGIINFEQPNFTIGLGWNF